MEKLLLNPFFAGQKLYVINYQYVGCPVKTGKVTSVFLKSQGVYEFLDKLLGRSIDYSRSRAVCCDGVAYGLNQVSLANTHAAIYKERVIFSARFGYNCLAGGIG